MLGYDTVFFTGADDACMIAVALREGRTVLTRDSELMKRRVITSGRLAALLLDSDVPEAQIRQVVKALKLDTRSHTFTRCLEDNTELEERSQEQVKDLVPPYVFRTQAQYRQCPGCGRVYWRGTHWQAMARDIEKICRD